MSYDVETDGKRFLAIKAGGQSGQQEFILVLNWFEELKRLGPVDKRSDSDTRQTEYHVLLRHLLNVSHLAYKSILADRHLSERESL